jgi:uncharacterized membrane protein YraQ (UPF0718 family)
MNREKGSASMLISTLILGVIALILLLVGYFRGNSQHIDGLRTAAGMFLTLLPLLCFAYIIAGMIQSLLPQDTLSRWVGAESGYRGILLGSFAGALAPGGPFICFPIVAGLARSGAGVGTVVAFVAGWSLWGINRLPLEFGILGWRLACIRIASTLIFPPLAGVIAQLIFGGGMK